MPRRTHTPGAPALAGAPPIPEEHLMIPQHIRNLTVAQADAFYEGEVSSVEAFAVINAAARSAWNYYDGISRDTHDLFDEQVGRRIDADADSWAQGPHTPRAGARRRAHLSQRGTSCRTCRTSSTSTTTPTGSRSCAPTARSLPPTLASRPSRRGRGTTTTT